MIESSVYNTALGAYALGARLAGKFGHVKARLMTDGQKQTLPRLKAIRREGERWVWIHAASLGEFEQGRPLIERLKRDHPELKVCLTFFSPSGYEVRADYAYADAVAYLPFDTPGNARRFVEILKPEWTVFVKYEFWRNYLRELRRIGSKTYLISAVFRPEQAFFRSWGKPYLGWLRMFDRIFVQDGASMNLLKARGIENVEVAGDTRFDRVTDIMRGVRPIAELDRFCGAKGSAGRAPMVLMAGSSWPEDEDVYAGWVNSRPEVKLVIAPHEFDAKRLERLRERFTHGAVLLSEAKEHPELLDGAQVLVIDCFGLLASAYGYADVAYIGGGFGAGIHNINEAAVYGVPVMFGPNNAKFIEAQELKALGGGIEISSADSFARHADRLLYDLTERNKRGRWAGEYISDQLGATDRIWHSLRL